MAMLMIAYDIYKGRTAEELGIPEIQYISRKELVDSFIKEWDGNSFEESYHQWTAKLYRDDADREEKILPSKKEMAKNAVVSAAKFIGSGLKLLSKEDALSRYEICVDCDKLIGGRCSVCGCYMKLKSRVAAMSCPDGLWGKQE
jgi:hypothetical protein